MLLIQLLIQLLLLLVDTTTALHPEQITCQLTRVLLASGDSMQFNIGMHVLPNNHTFSSFMLTTSSTRPPSHPLTVVNPSAPVNNVTTPTIATTTATCHWVVVARLDETTDTIPTPTALQIRAGVDSEGANTGLFGSFSGLNSMLTKKGESSDFGQIMFVVVTTKDGTNALRTSQPRRLVMPRRCRYSHEAVVVPAGWSFKTNMTRNLAYFGVSSFPQAAAPESTNIDVSAASLASRLYISGGTYDSSSSWRDPLSGTFKATGYW